MNLVLRDGFHGHAVLITIDGRRIYDAAGVTTDPLTTRAAALTVAALGRTARLEVSVTPGRQPAAFDVDVTAHPHVAISLVGQGTVAFESSADPSQ